MNGSAGRCLEFLPIILTYRIEGEYVYINDNLRCDITGFINSIARFSYLNNGKCYTNARAILNSGLPYEFLPYNNGDDEYSYFKAVRIKVPFFVFSQIKTHTRLTIVAQSDRVSEGNGYWLPEDLVKKVREFKPVDDMSDSERNVYNSFKELQLAIDDKTLAEDFLTKMLDGWSQNLTQDILKLLGYKREIWSRAPYYFKYKECVVTGWYNDPTTWQHSFLERSVEPDSWKNWTQKETKEVMSVVKEIIENNIK